MVSSWPWAERRGSLAPVYCRPALRARVSIGPAAAAGLRAGLHAGQVGQIAEDGLQTAAQLAMQAISGGGFPAEHGEAVAGLQQLGHRLKADAGAATGEQHVSWRAT